MPRLRFRAGGQDSSSAAITALANAEIPEHISDEDESRDGVGAVHVRGVLQEILEERVLLAFSGGESVEGRGEKSKNTRTRSAEMRSGRGSGGPLDSIDMKDDAEELSGFIEYLADELYENLPGNVKATIDGTPALEDVSNECVEKLVRSTPLSVVDSLIAYGVLPSQSEGASEDFLSELYRALLETVKSQAVDTPSGLKPRQVDACQLCARSYIPLTAHHLIPRQVHVKAIKRGWVTDLAEFQTRIAWVCRACHNFVHRIARNEELARYFNTVEALEEREDVQKWVKWIGRVRWKKR